MLNAKRSGKLFDVGAGQDEAGRQAGIVTVWWMFADDPKRAFVVWSIHRAPGIFVKSQSN